MLRHALCSSLCGLALFAGSGSGSAAADEDAIRGFVSVEPFEVRLEAIVKVAAFAEEWGLEEGPVGLEERPGILERLGERFAAEVALLSPGETGEALEFTRRTLRFIVPDPVQGYAEDERESIPLEEALVGLTFSADERGVRGFRLRWSWFAPGQERLVLEVSSAGRPAARYLAPESGELSWALAESEQTPAPALLPVPAPQRESCRPLRRLLFPGVLLLTAAALVAARRRRATPVWVYAIGVLGFAAVAGAALLEKERIVVPEGEEREELVHALLRNVYHAFDFRAETEIYDTLAHSVGGRLLERVYLEIRDSLELETRGGPRVRVHEVALRDVVFAGFDPGGGEGLSLRANWATVGEVTHWGHTHERTNRYEAILELAAEPPREGPAGASGDLGSKEGGAHWKVVGLDLLNEERVQRLSRFGASPEEEVAPPSDEGGASGDPAPEGDEPGRGGETP